MASSKSAYCERTTIEDTWMEKRSSRRTKEVMSSAAINQSTYCYKGKEREDEYMSFFFQIIQLCRNTKNILEFSYLRY